MNRRHLIAMLGATAAASSLAARAQQPGKRPTIGFLGAGARSTRSEWTAALVQRLGELGWIEGRTIAIEYRWAEGRSDRAPEVMAEFVRLNVDVIVTYTTTNARAAKQATSAIPIVFAASSDPLGTDLVASLARPGGNLTGLSIQNTDTAGKRIELLRAIVPGLRRVAMLGGTGSATNKLERAEIQAVARALDFEVIVQDLRRTEDIAPAIEALPGRADALMVGTGPLFSTNRILINTLALGARLPTSHAFREALEGGGLMSYGPDFVDLFRRAGDYVDKILRGAKPADMPVEQPTKFELVVNLGTAKALGLTVSQSLLARADEVIE